MLITIFVLALASSYCVSLFADAVFDLIFMLCFGSSDSLKSYAALRVGLAAVSCVLQVVQSILQLGANVTLTTLRYFLSLVVVSLFTVIVFLLYNQYPGTLLTVIDAWNEMATPVLHTVVIIPVKIFSDALIAIVPLYNFIVWIFQKILYQTFLRISIETIDAFVLLGTAVANFCIALATSMTAYSDQLITCLFASTKENVQTDAYCVQPFTRALDLYTPMKECRQMAIALALISRAMCRSTAFVVDIWLYPFLDVNLAKSVHYLTNGILESIIHIPMQTALRCARFRTKADSVIPCLPDYESAFDYLAQGVLALGRLLDNWLNIVLVILQQTLTGTSPVCASLGDQLSTLWSVAGDRVFGTNLTAMVAMTSAMLAETDGYHVRYTHTNRVSTTAEYHLDAWPFPIDVSLGAAAVTFLPNTDMDLTGSSSTALFGCTCLDDAHDGLRLRCAVLRYSPDPNNAAHEIPVEFSLPTASRYLLCKHTKIRIESVRWPMSRVVGVDTGVYRSMSKFEMPPSCFEAGSSCTSIDATVWVQPACGILNGRSDIENSLSCISSFKKSNCYPFCIGVHTKGSANSAITLYGAQQWVEGTFLNSRDCTRWALTLTDPSASTSGRTASTTDPLNDPLQMPALETGKWDDAVGCVYSETATSMIPVSLPQQQDYSTGFFIYPEQPFVVVGDVALTIIRSTETGDVTSVAVKRLFEDERGGITLLQTNLEIPARRACFTQSCDAPEQGILEVPFEFYRIPHLHTPATTSSEHVFFSTTPDLETLDALARQCRAQLASLDLIVWSNIAPLRIWRVPAYTSAARCGRYCKQSKYVDIWKLAESGVNRDMAVTVECDAIMGIRVVQLEYMNENNILFRVQKTSLKNLDPFATRGVVDVSQVTFETYFLNPQTLMVRKDHAWDPEYEISTATGVITTSSNDILSKINDDSAKIGRFCPALVRMPSFGTALTRLISATLNLIRVYPIRISAWFPILTSKEDWKSVQLCNDPTARFAGYTHSAFKTCGPQFFYIDAFFEDVYVANTLLWQSLAIASSALAYTGSGATPAITFLNGVSTFGAQTSLAATSGVVSSIKLAFTKDSIPVDAISQKLTNTVLQFPRSTFSVYAATIHPLAAAEFGTKFTLTLITDILNSVYGAAAARAPEFILWDSVYRLRILYESIVLTKQFRACDALALTVDYHGPLGQFVRSTCFALVYAAHGALEFMSAFFVDIPTITCVCVDAKGHNLKTYIRDVCFPRAPVEYRPLLYEMYYGLDYDDTKVCEALLSLGKLHIETSMNPTLNELYDSAEAAAGLISYAGSLIDGQSLNCKDAYTNPHTFLITPDPIDYFRVCGITSNCHMRCAQHWDEFERAMGQTHSSAKQRTDKLQYDFPNDIFQSDGTDPPRPGDVILSAVEPTEVYHVCGRSISEDTAVCVVYLSHSYNNITMAIEFRNNRLSVACYCIPSHASQGIYASANPRETDWVVVDDIHQMSTPFTVRDAQFFANSNAVVILTDNDDANIMVFKKDGSSGKHARDILNTFLVTNLDVLELEIRSVSVTAIACSILSRRCLLDLLGEVAPQADIRSQKKRILAFLDIEYSYAYATVTPVKIRGYDWTLSDLSLSRQQSTDYVFITRSNQMLAVPRDSKSVIIGNTNTDVSHLALCTVDHFGFDCKQLHSNLAAIIKNVGLGSSLSLGGRNSESIGSQGRLAQNSLSSIAESGQLESLKLFVIVPTHKWLRQGTIEGLSKAVVSARSAFTRDVAIDISVQRKCGPSFCSACSAINGLQHACYNLEDCILRRCIGTIVSQDKVLCAIGGIVESYMNMQLQMSVVGWRALTETISDVLMLGIKQDIQYLHIEWPEDAFYNVICEAKDVTAQASTLITSLLYNIVHFARNPIEYVSSRVLNIDAEFNVILTMSLMATTNFINQCFLGLLYPYLAMQKAFICQTNAMMAALNPTSFSLSIGNAEISALSDGALGQCLTAGASAALDSMTLEKDIRQAIVSSLVQVRAVIRGLPIAQILHPVDAFFTWLTGVFTGIQDIIATSDQANCMVPDFHLANAMRCACGDKAVRISRTRSNEGIAHSAFWCTGSLHILDADGVGRVVYNPYTYTSLYNALAAQSLEPEKSRLQSYMDCIASSQTTSTCHDNLPALRDLQSQHVSIIQVFSKCRTNYALKQWDTAAHALFLPTDTSPVVATIASQMHNLLTPASESDGQCLLVEHTRGAAASEICLQKMLQRINMKADNYFEYYEIPSTLKMDSVYVDACRVFSGQQSFEQCSTHVTRVHEFEYDENTYCTLPSTLWLPTSHNRVPVAVSHGLTATEFLPEHVRNVHSAVVDEVLDVLDSEKYKEWSDHSTIEYSLFSTDGDALHQMFDCFFLGPFASTRLSPHLHGKIPALTYARRHDDPTSRAFDVPCAAGVDGYDKLNGDYQSPFTCGTEARRSIIKYFVRDRFFSDENDRSARSKFISKQVRAFIGRIRDQWTRARGEIESLGCLCDDGLLTAIACCRQLDEINAFVPMLLRNLTISRIPSDILTNATLEQVQAFLESDVQQTPFTTLIHTHMSKQARETYAATMDQHAETIKEHGLFDTAKPTIKYDETEVFNILHNSSTPSKSILDICMNTYGATIYTLPLRFTDAFRQWFPEGVDPQTPPKHNSESDATYLEQVVQSVTAAAFQKSPLFWSHDTRYVPSDSEFCGAAHGARETNAKPSPIYGPLTYSTQELLQGYSINLMKVPDMNASNKFWHFPEEYFGFDNFNNTCPCGWILPCDDVPCSLVCKVPADVCKYFESMQDSILWTICKTHGAIIDLPTPHRLEIEMALATEWQSNWSCPFYERIHGGWGAKSERWNLNNNISVVRDILRDGWHGLRMSNFKFLLENNTKHTAFKINTRPNRFSTGHGPWLRHCEDEHEMFIKNKTNLAERFVDELFPAAQAVRTDTTLAACTRYILELARSYVFKELGVVSEDIDESIVRWQQRCDTQLEFMDTCKIFNVQQSIAALSRADRTKHHTTCKASFIDIDSHVATVYITEQCLFITTDLQVYDPCACNKCGVDVAQLSIDDITNTSTCLQHSLHGGQIGNIFGLGTWPTYTDRPDVNELRDYIQEIMQSSAESSIRLSSAAEWLLTDVTDTHRHTSAAEINRPVTKRHVSWLDVEGFAKQYSRKCDGLVDWWPSDWGHILTGMHPTTSCSAKNTRYMVFDNAYAVDTSTDPPMVFYDPNKLRWPRYSRNHFGAGGRCNVFSYGMDMVISNTVRFCTDETTASSEDPMIHSNFGFDQCSTKNKEHCTDSPFLVPWTLRSTPWVAANWRLQAIGSLLVEDSFYDAKTGEFPDTYLIASILLKQFDDPWGDTECGLLALLDVEDPAFCKAGYGELRRGTCAAHACDRHADCANETMCNGFGECVQPVVEFANFNPVHEVEVQWFSEQCHQETRGDIIVSDAISIEDISVWENAPYILHDTGLCGTHNWYDRHIQCLGGDRDKQCRLNYRNIAKQSSLYVSRNPQTLVSDHFFTMPTACDMQYMYTEGHEVCRPRMSTQGQINGPLHFNRTRFTRGFRARDTPAGFTVYPFANSAFDNARSTFFFTNDSFHSSAKRCASLRQCELPRFTKDFEKTTRTLASGRPYTPRDQLQCGPFAYLHEDECRIDTKVASVRRVLCDVTLKSAIDESCGIRVPVRSSLCADQPLYDNMDPASEEHNARRLAIANELNALYNEFSNTFTDVTDTVLRESNQLRCATVLHASLNYENTLYYFGSYTTIEFPFAWFFRCVVISGVRIPLSLSDAKDTNFLVNCPLWDNTYSGSSDFWYERMHYAGDAFSVDVTRGFPILQGLINVVGSTTDRTDSMWHIVNTTISHNSDRMSTIFGRKTRVEVLRKICLRDGVLNSRLMWNNDQTNPESQNEILWRYLYDDDIATLRNGVDQVCSAYASNSEIEPCLFPSVDSSGDQNIFAHTVADGADLLEDFYKSIEKSLVYSDIKIQTTSDTLRWRTSTQEYRHTVPYDGVSSTDFSCTTNRAAVTNLMDYPHAFTGDYTAIFHLLYYPHVQDSSVCPKKIIDGREGDPSTMAKRNYIGTSTDPLHDFSSEYNLDMDYKSTSENGHLVTLFDVCSRNVPKHPIRQQNMSINSLKELKCINGDIRYLDDMRGTYCILAINDVGCNSLCLSLRSCSCVDLARDVGYKIMQSDMCIVFSPNSDSTANYLYTNMRQMQAIAVTPGLNATVYDLDYTTNEAAYQIQDMGIQSEYYELYNFSCPTSTSARVDRNTLRFFTRSRTLSELQTAYQRVFHLQNGEPNDLLAADFNYRKNSWSVMLLDSYSFITIEDRSIAGLFVNLYVTRVNNPNCATDYACSNCRGYEEVNGVVNGPFTRDYCYYAFKIAPTATKSSNVVDKYVLTMTRNSDVISIDNIYINDFVSRRAITPFSTTGVPIVAASQPTVLNTPVAIRAQPANNMVHVSMYIGAEEGSMCIHSTTTSDMIRMCPNGEILRNIYGKLHRCSSCTRPKSLKICSGPTTCGYPVPPIFPGDTANRQVIFEEWHIVESDPNKILKKYFEDALRIIAYWYLESPSATIGDLFTTPPISRPIFESSRSSMLESFPSFSMAAAYDIESSIRENILACLQADASGQIQEALDYQKCSNDVRRQELIAHVSKHFMHELFPILEQGSFMSWPISKSQLLSRNSVSWARAFRPLTQRHVSNILDKRQCFKGLRSTTYCSLNYLQSNGSLETINPWFGGHFNPVDNCDTRQLGVETLLVDSSCNIDECKFKNPNLFFGCNKEDGMPVTNDFVTAYTATSNICRLRNALNTRVCNHTQGALGNDRGTMTQSLRCEHKAPDDAATFSLKFGINRLKLFYGADTAHGSIQMHADEIGGHHLVFALNRMNQMRVVRVPLFGTNHLFTKQGIRQPGTVDDAHADDDVQWLEDYATRHAAEEDKSNRRLYREVRNGSVPHWSCPLRRVSFYQYHALVPDPRRAHREFALINENRFVHPMQVSKPLSLYVKDTYTADGFTYFSNANTLRYWFYERASLGLPGSFIPRYGSWISTLMRLITGDRACNHVDPSSFDHAHMDWPHTKLQPLRDGSRVNETTYAKKNPVLSRLRRFAYRYKHSNAFLAHDETTSVRGGDCHMGHAIPKTSLDVLNNKGCVFSYSTPSAFYFACRDVSEYVQINVSEQASPYELLKDGIGEYCDECTVPPKFMSQSTTPESAYKEDKRARLSYGILTRLGAARKLAASVRNAICGYTNRCPQLQNVTWNASLFLHSFFSNPRALLHEYTGNSSESYHSMLKQKNATERAILDAENVLWEDVPWVMCDADDNTSTACGGNIKRDVWLSAERASECRRVITEQEIQRPGASAMNISFCDMHKDLNDLCLFLESSTRRIQKANCMYAGHCSVDGFFYEPSVYSVSNREFVRSTVRNFYENIQTGVCQSDEDGDTSARIYSESYLGNCAANGIQKLKEYMQKLRAVLTTIIRLVYAYYMLILSLLQYAFTIGSAQDMARTELTYWWTEFKDLGASLIATLADILYELIFELANGFGKHMHDVIQFICEAVNLIVYKYLIPFACTIFHFVTDLLLKIINICKSVNALGVLDRIIEDLEAVVISIKEALSCEDIIELQCSLTKIPDNAEEDLNKLPVPSRCWTGYRPSLGASLDSAIPTCSASSTCRRSRLGGEVDNGKDDLVLCDACPSTADPTIERFGCDWLSHSCVCGVPSVERTPCTANEHCSSSSPIGSNEGATCMLLTENFDEFLGTVACSSCSSESMCVLEDASRPHGYCACPIIAPTLATCDEVGTRAIVLEPDACLTVADTDLSTTLSTSLQYAASWDKLVLTNCIHVDTSSLFCYNVRMYNNEVLQYAVALRLLATGSAFNSLYGPSRRLLSDGDSEDPYYVDWDGGALACQDAATHADILASTLLECVYWRDVGNMMIRRFNMTHFTNEHVWTSYNYMLWVVANDTLAFAQDVARPDVLFYVFSHTHVHRALVKGMRYLQRNLQRSLMYNALLYDIHKAQTLANASKPGNSLPPAYARLARFMYFTSMHTFFPRAILKAKKPPPAIVAYTENCSADTAQYNTSNSSRRLLAYDEDLVLLSSWPPRYEYTNGGLLSEFSCRYVTDIAHDIVNGTKLLGKVYRTSAFKFTREEFSRNSLRAHLPDTKTLSNQNAKPLNRTSSDPFLSVIFGAEDYINMTMITSLFSRANVETILTDLVTCPLERVISCSAKRRDFFWGIVIAIGVPLLISLTLGGISRSVIINFLFYGSVAPSLAVCYVYGVSPLCLPMVPVCFIVDSSQYLQDSFPTQLRLPSSLINQSCVEDGSGKCLLQCDAPSLSVNDTARVLAWWYCDLLRGAECFDDVARLRNRLNSTRVNDLFLDDVYNATQINAALYNLSAQVLSVCTPNTTLASSGTEQASQWLCPEGMSSAPRDQYVAKRYCALISSCFLVPVTLLVLMIPYIAVQFAQTISIISMYIVLFFMECLNYVIVNDT